MLDFGSNQYGASLGTVGSDLSYTPSMSDPRMSSDPYGDWGGGGNGQGFIPQNSYLNHGLFGDQNMPSQGTVEQYGMAGAAALSDLANGYTQMRAAHAQASFMSTESQINLMHATQTVGSILGPQESYELGKTGEKGSAVAGADRAIYAGQGVNVNAGSALTEQQQTGEQTHANESNVRMQDVLQAYGVTQEAQNRASQQNFDAMASQTQGNQQAALGLSQAYNQLAGTYEESQRTKSFMGGMA